VTDDPGATDDPAATDDPGATYDPGATDAPAVTDDPSAPVEEWHRLHPLSAVVRAGRGVLAILVLLLISTFGGGNNSGDLFRLGAVGVALVAGFVSWLVTRWRVEQGVLRIDSGLLRRQSQRLPLSQVQAIDTVRPGLARVLGLTELRVRTAGAGGSSGRLAYLTDFQANLLRARLLALAHGVDQAAPPPPERPLLTVPTGQLVASLLSSGPGLTVEALVAALVVLGVVAPSALGPVVGAGTAVFLGSAGALWQRFNGDYRLTVAEAPDGLRLRSGLVETSAETIPRGRVQALRMTEPLLWRPFGWCRVEVDLAGKATSGRQNRSARRAGRALLPVGSHAQAAWLIERVMPGVPPVERRPPERARWKSPLRFRHLAWGLNETYATTTSGRVRRVTDWVALAKVQSIRRIEGPVQRRLRLVSIHLDTAGRSVHAVIRDPDRGEGDHIMAGLPEQCRQARRRDQSARLGKGLPPLVADREG